MTGTGAAAWIEDGEKYALVGLSIKLEGQIPSEKISPNLWVLPDTGVIGWEASACVRSRIAISSF